MDDAVLHRKGLIVRKILLDTMDHKKYSVGTYLKLDISSAYILSQGISGNVFSGCGS